jgi:hypothetical protein
MVTNNQKTQTAFQVSIFGLNEIKQVGAFDVVTTWEPKSFGLYLL